MTTKHPIACLFIGSMKFWQEYREIRTLIFTVEMKIATTILENSLGVSTKVNICLPYDPAVVLLEH